MKTSTLISGLFFISLFFQSLTLLSQSGLKVRATGTGQTTGIIADLSVTNTSDKPIVIKPLIMFIPTSGKYQSYVGRINPVNSIAAGESASIPVTGYCTDVHKPPVANGSAMPPIEEWICIQDPGNTPAPLNGISIIPSAELPPFSFNDIPNIISAPGFTSKEIDPNAPIIATWPGSDIPINGSIHLSKNEIHFAPLIIEAVIQIEKTAYELVENGVVITPFSNDSKREAEALIQQTIWIYLGALTGENYTKDDFSDQMIVQYETKTKTEIEEASVETVERLEKGIDDFWSAFELVGLEAKVISVADGLPSGIRSEMEKGMGAVDSIAVKPNTGAAADVAAGALGASASSDNAKPVAGASPGPSTAAHEAAHTGAEAKGGTTTGPAEAKVENGSAEAGEINPNNNKDIPDKEVVKRGDFNPNKQIIYEGYLNARKSGISHKDACRKYGVNPESELGKALKRVFEKESRHQN